MVLALSQKGVFRWLTLVTHPTGSGQMLRFHSKGRNDRSEGQKRRTALGLPYEVLFEHVERRSRSHQHIFRTMVKNTLSHWMESIIKHVDTWSERRTGSQLLKFMRCAFSESTEQGDQRRFDEAMRTV
jgi:hypothetical protein